MIKDLVERKEIVINKIALCHNLANEKKVSKPSSK